MLLAVLIFAAARQDRQAPPGLIAAAVGRWGRRGRSRHQQHGQNFILAGGRPQLENPVLPAQFRSRPPTSLSVAWKAIRRRCPAAQRQTLAQDCRWRLCHEQYAEPDEMLSLRQYASIAS
jgi:hypothetical protein